MENLEGLGYRGKTVVVTGGFSGMGEAVLRILGDLGAKVHVVDIKKPTVSHAGFYECDLSKPEQVAATASALGKIGPIDFLFPCAGVPPHLLGAQMCMKINFIGTRQLTEALIPSMADKGGIAIISSDAGVGWQKDLATRLELLAIEDPVEAGRWCEERPEVVRDGYTTSKEMLIVWVQKRCVSLAEERGIRINCIGPCPTKTPFMDVTVPALGESFFETYPLPLLGRMATPEEQAWPLILLNSPLNNVVTGAVLYTDQGFASGLLTGAIDTSILTPKE